MSEPVVYGDPISTYVRSVRLALAEKGVQGSTYMADSDADSDEARVLRPLRAVNITARCG